MAETAIEWTHTVQLGQPVKGYTFNPWVGCQKVGPGCDNCYAEQVDKRWVKKDDPAYGTAPHWGPHADRRLSSEQNWKTPLTWNRKARKNGTQPFVFCASLADVWDNAVPIEWLKRLVALWAATPDLLWLVLTKRPQNIMRRLEALGIDRLPGNVALGCTIVNQDEANRDIITLCSAANLLGAAFTFLSMEPLLGRVDLEAIYAGPGRCNVLSGEYTGGSGAKLPWYRIGWVIAGGESGPFARPTDPYWIELIQQACAQHEVPFHLKQWGAWAPMWAIPQRLLAKESKREKHRKRGVIQFGANVVANVHPHKVPAVMRNGESYRQHPVVPAVKIREVA